MTDPRFYADAVTDGAARMAAHDALLPADLTPPRLTFTSTVRGAEGPVSMPLAPGDYTLTPAPSEPASVAWPALWHEAGHHAFCAAGDDCPTPGAPHPDYDATIMWSIDRLADAGYRPDEDDADNVDAGQSLLALAALRCPALMADG